MLSQLLLFCLANFGRSRVCVCGLYRYLDLAEGVLKVSLVLRHAKYSIIDVSY